MTDTVNIVGAEWEARQPQKVLDAFDHLENLLKSDPVLLKNLMTDDMDMEEELSYLDDEYADFTEDNRDWIYETMKVNLKARYDEHLRLEDEADCPEKCDRCGKGFTGSGFGDDEYAGTCNSSNPKCPCKFPDPMRDFHLCGECMGVLLVVLRPPLVLLLGDDEVICLTCKEDAEEEKDDGFEDCDCGYTHHYEDKCPNEETAHHYVRWGVADDAEEEKEEKHEAEWEEVYNSTGESSGVAKDYRGRSGKFYQTYGNGGGKNGFGGYWINDSGSVVYRVAGYTYTYLKDATVEYRNQRSMSGICAAIRVNVDANPPEPDGDGSDDE